MFGNSIPVTSNQDGIHPDLQRVLERHRAAHFRKPISAHTLQAFEHMRASWSRAGKPSLVLDAGCGVGWSTLRLALRHPDHLVVGVDQSAQRLQRGPASAVGNPANLLLLRADLVDFWRLLAAHRMALSHHYLLYPNPWPRKQHLGRRWHGHPVFPVIVALGGTLECRSNWIVYLQEFAIALQVTSGSAAQILAWDPPDGTALTPFEKKYRASGHGLWRCCVNLSEVYRTGPDAPVLR
jgi:tRNA (guanine-N7-)-methyltransferase